MCRRNAPPTCTFARPDSPEQPVDESHGNRLLRVMGLSRRHITFAEPSFGRATIAISILVPCSASSMLSAPLRPGRPPGLRALTTPPHGTFSANCAMVVSVSMARMRLTRRSHRRILATSRQCRMALPPFAATANGARIRPAPTGHGIERNPQKSQSDARRPRAVRRRRLSCEPRCLSPRVILRIIRCAEDAFTSGIASPWL